MDGRPLKVGGYTPFSTTDYPGQLSAVVFVQGCPWRCGYCHNPHLQPRTRDSPLSWSALLAGLQRRVGLLDAVVFCGGEATMDPALGGAIQQVRALGFKVGLETACIYPDRLRKLLPTLDWVGFDVKAPFDRYADITGVAGSGEPARASVEAILASGVDYECRTTVHPAQLPPPVLMELAKTLADMGVTNYVLQEFRATGCDNEALVAAAIAGYPGEDTLTKIAPMFPRFAICRSH
jgi:anaerobic ribonucleoside-triphosphate reductase activating protein